MIGAFLIATGICLFITFVVLCTIRAGKKADDKVDYAELEATMGRIVKRINEGQE